MAFQSGTLWEKVAETTAKALKSGALEPIPTEFEFVEDQGIDFVVRVARNFAKKTKRQPATDSGKLRNPFLPFEPELYVADASATHVCLLNKFNVVDHHLLIVTRSFEHQQTPLNASDFSALWSCLTQYESLGFYNSAMEAGASQTHKHMQVVPLPLTERRAGIPVEPLIQSTTFRNGIGSCDALPYRHGIARLDNVRFEGDAVAGIELSTIYRRLLDFVGITATVDFAGLIIEPYNLLLTQDWMFLVPRIHGSFGGISINALGFAGALLVRDNQQLEQLKSQGPLVALSHVSGLGKTAN